jgi:3-hydroxy-3-methylglutaryl CoA synthase
MTAKQLDTASGDTFESAVQGTPPMLVGIDRLNVYAATQFVDFRELAEARRLSPKDLRNVGFERRSVVPLFEDPVTLAVNAAKPIADDVSDIELLIVATETGLDFGKPLSTYVHAALGLPMACRNFEIKHACFGGTAALQTAVAHVRSARPGAKALVVMTDIARCHIGDPAEITAGSGAVALLISENPSIAVVSRESGRAAREVYDVARPTQTTEWNDAVKSLFSYLDLVEGAWGEYKKLAKADSLQSHFAYMLYHAPLVSLIQRAHGALLEADDADIDSDAVSASVAAMVMPSFGHNRQLGNIYSGSLYASIAGLIDNQDSAIAEGTRIGCFSYGSGACSELFALTMRATARATVGAARIGDHLAARARLTPESYERQIRELEHAMTLADFVPTAKADDLYETHYAGRGRLVLDRVENGYRRYRQS